MYCYSIWNCYSICKVWYFPVRFIFLWQLMLPHLKSIWQIERIQFAKVNGPDQNAINLSSLNLTSLQKSLLSKGPSFVPTPKDVNWYELRKNFTKFVNQLRFKLKQYQLNQDHQNQQELSNPIQSKNLPNEASLLPPPLRRV